RRSCYASSRRQAHVQVDRRAAVHVDSSHVRSVALLANLDPMRTFSQLDGESGITCRTIPRLPIDHHDGIVGTELQRHRPELPLFSRIMRNRSLILVTVRRILRGSLILVTV